MAELQLQYPVTPAKINQGWGFNGDWYRKNDINVDGHNGIDFWAPDGWNVKAAHDGQVVFVGYDSKEGLGITIRTTAMFEYEGKNVHFKTIYWHLKEGTPRVKPGDLVKSGDVIAQADNTGFSTGSHLHFGLKPIKVKGDGKSTYNIEQNNGYYGAIDPTDYFSGEVEEPEPVKVQIDDTFTAGDRVRVTESDLNIRKILGLKAEVIAQQDADVEGTIVGGGIHLDDHVWYEVSFDNGVKGWCSMTYLEKVVEQPEERVPHWFSGFIDKLYSFLLKIVVGLQNK